jgi:hypothetical protein
MLAKQEYDSYVDRLNSATVAVLVLAAAVFLFTPAVAQINGTPASVTSTNFGGRFTSTPGVPASITSLGPNGIQPGSALFPPACCINPLFPVNPNPPLFQRHHHHRQNSFFPAGGAVYVPYPVSVEPEADDTAEQPNPADDDRGGPTIFDRRGSGQPARRFLDDYPQRPRAQSEIRDQSERGSATSAPSAEAPVPDQPQTVLIFKDGHQVEVQNYAVVGSMLYDLTPGHHRKIAVADLDLKATAKQNDDLGISFQLPPAPDANKYPDTNK